MQPEFVPKGRSLSAKAPEVSARLKRCRNFTLKAAEARVEALEPRQLLSFALLTQENFQSNITSTAPDTFNSVTGTLYSDAVGPATPAVANPLGVSGDPQEAGDAAQASTNPLTATWTLNDSTKINSNAANGGFMGGWFRFTFTDDDTYPDHTADLMKLTGGPTVQLDGAGSLEAYAGYPSGVIVPQNQWVFIGLAWTFNTSGLLNFNLYTKLPGQALTQVYSSPVSITTATAPTAASLVDLPDGGINNGRWEGRAGTFFIASIGSLSDVQIPSDITDPVEQKHWYGVDPVNGNDNNDGIVIPEFAVDGTTVIGFAAGSQPWKTLTRVNTALTYDGVFTQNNPWLNASGGTPVDESQSVTTLQSDIAAGTVIRNPLIDELVIDTASGPFNIAASGGVNESGGIQLTTNINLSGFGSTVGTMSNVGDLQAFVSIPKNSWTPVPGDSNLYETSNTAANAVLWENREWLYHMLGSSFSAVQSQLDQYGGSFWTDGTTMYVHPLNNTNPATDSNVYERSPGGASTNSIGLLVNVNDPYVHNLAIGGTCGADPVTNDPIGLYCIGTSGSEGLGVFDDLYLYYSSKHAFCWTGGQVNQRLIVENVDCEQGSPYAGVGGQYLYTNYNDSTTATGNQVLYLNCTSTHSFGLFDSTQGQTIPGEGTFYSHNNGGTDQFSDITLINCNFDDSVICTDAIQNLIIENSIVGTVSSGASDTTAVNDTSTEDIIRCSFGTITYCIMHIDEIYSANGNFFQGTVTYLDDLFDSRGAGTQTDPSYFYRTGPSTLTVEGCTFLATAEAPLLSYFQTGTDVLVFKNNTYDTVAASLFASNLQINGGIYVYNLADWQAAGYDTGSVQAADGSVPTNYTTADIGSPATAGTSITNNTDGMVTQEGGGTGIGGTFDQFNFIYASVNGNVSYSVQIAAQLGAGTGAVAGLMLRGSTAANSAFADVAVVEGQGIEFQWRSANGATAQSVSVPSISAPVWVKLSRSGNSITAYYSTNDSTWIQIGTTQTVTMPTTALIGTVVAGTPTTATTAALFSKVVTPGPTLNSFQVNDGSAQRAMVDSLTLVFSEPVTFNNPLTLYQVQPNDTMTAMPFIVSSPDGGTTWVLKFTEAQYVGGSLPDGNYSLAVSGLGITDGFGASLQGGNQQFSFYRFYGDFFGAGVVNGNDFALLAKYFGHILPSTYWYIDYDNTGLDNGASFAQLAARFGKSSPPAPAVVIEPTEVTTNTSTLLTTPLSTKKHVTHRTIRHRRK
jgi:hypothetical protein